MFSVPRGSHASSHLPFLGNINALGSYPLLGGTYPPSNVWKQGRNYLSMVSSYQGGYSFSPSPYIGGPYDPSGLKTSLPLE